MPTVVPSAATWGIVLLLACLSGLTTLLFAIAFASALAEPAGALVGLAAVQVYPALNTFLIAVAAGAMIFVSVHELLPMAAEFGNLPLFAAGVALSVPVYALLRWIVPG